MIFMSIPYTYYVEWTAHGVKYYGVRYAKNCDPSDLWVKYFTSSALVKQMRETRGEPDRIEVRKTFDTPEAARKWEAAFLKKVRAPSSKLWLNMTDHNDRFYREGPRGEFSSDHRKKLSEAAKRRKLTPEHKEKLNASRRGKVNSAEHKAALRKARIGTKHTPEARAKMSEAARARSARNRESFA